ncbi:MAG: Beta-barrel assembly-enhancing protease [Candidatus Marinimicrobia bacterium]|nr:Beta-barrel assembly-enhancing protease [Candidatus Neomarinimicrobiota bacterium]
MKRTMTVLVFLSCILFMSVTVFAESGKITRKRATLREGPGSFFPAVAELQKGNEVEVLKTEEHWLQVSITGMTGYISKKAIEGSTEKSDDPFAQMSSKPSVTKVAQSGVSAAVKGFAEKYAKRLDGDESFLNTLYSYHINPREYRQFREATYTNRNKSKIYRKVDLPRLRSKDVFSFSEEGVGLGIASRLASMGIYENKKLQDYVNHVGNLVVEASDAYDQQIKFFILDVDKVNAYACPGGIIFVTRGAIKRMQDEAELACFLGHEIAHVVLRHGMKELEKRKPMVTADNAFAELEGKTNMSEEMQDTSDELESIALESYETIFAGRLQEYEDEADSYGCTIAARAGFDPESMVSFLGRLSQEGDLSGNEHYTTDQNRDRQYRIQRWITRTGFPDNLFETNLARFQRMKQGL